MFRFSSHRHLCVALNFDGTFIVLKQGTFDVSTMILSLRLHEIREPYWNGQIVAETYNVEIDFPQPK